MNTRVHLLVKEKSVAIGKISNQKAKETVASNYCVGTNGESQLTNYKNTTAWGKHDKEVYLQIQQKSNLNCNCYSRMQV